MVKFDSSGTAYPAGTAYMLAEYAEELLRMPEKACAKGGAASPFMRTIPGIYRQIDPEDAAAEKVRLPPDARPMAGKTGAEKALENIRTMRTRVIAEKPEMSALSEEEKKEASVLIEVLSAEEKSELVHLAGGDYNTMTPLLIREYLWRKKNRRKLSGLADDIREAEYRAFRLSLDKWNPYPSGTPPVSMAVETNPGGKKSEAGHKAFELTSDKENPYFHGSLEKKSSSHGTDGSSISPVIAEYLMARAAGKRQDSTNEEVVAGIGSPAATLEIPMSRHERIELEEPHKTGGTLRNSLEELSEMRIPAGKADPMAIMNADYEHDKAVLAKTDPMSARNQFHDVGHADGSGEILDKRTANKIIMSKSDEEISKLMEAK